MRNTRMMPKNFDWERINLRFDRRIKELYEDGWKLDDTKQWFWHPRLLGHQKNPTKGIHRSAVMHMETIFWNHKMVTSRDSFIL